MRTKGIPVRHQETVVVVEDDPAMGKALRRLLNVAGFSAKVFSSAEALLESGEADRAACFVLDVRLPGASGFELLRRLQESGRSPRAIVITAQEDDHIRDEAIRSGAEAFFTKPFEGRRLIEVVRDLVGSHAATATG